MNWLVGRRRSHLLKSFAVLASLLLLLTPVSFAVQVQYLYDANGNMVSDGVYCYSYNDANQLSEVRDCSSNELISEYLYDHSGQRSVKKQYDSGVLQYTVYYVSRLFESKVYANGSVENTSYYFVNGERVARRDKDGVTYYHSDHLGSASVLTDEAGSLVEETQYYPFGSVRAGGTQSKYLYTSQENDPETGLYYYGARYYNPELMRFVQADPIIQDIYDPQSLNRYSYVRNNPLKYTDPTGKIFFVPFLIMVAVGVAFEINYLSNNPNPTLEGTLTEGFVGTTSAAVTMPVAGAVGTKIAGAAAGPGVAAWEAEVLGMGGASIVGGQTFRATENLLTGEEVTEGLLNPDDMLTDLVVGEVALGVCKAGGKLAPSKATTPKTPEISRSELPENAKNTLKSIDDGGPFQYKKDGTIWENRASQLPEQELGYYKEYTIPTEGSTTRGTCRFVVGKNGETYYTTDHYESFQKVTE